MLMVLFFSLGLAGVLTTVGLLFVKGSRLLQGTSKFERLAHHVPMGSAIVILIIGVTIVFTSLSG
jgi:ABC-type nickel/cobalt efflux system permease component RcnA